MEIGSCEVFEMNSAAIVGRFNALLEELQLIISEAEIRILVDEDPYFIKNANFLTKSFLISLCCYLEVFLKDMANAHVNDSKERIIAAKVPHNLLSWSLNKELKPKDQRYGSFVLPLTPKDIDDELSGNPFRTSKCFKLLGVELDTVQDFSQNTDVVNSVVAKRNNIIHHNDTAADVSLGDIRMYSGQFKLYALAIAEAVQTANIS